MRSAVVRRRRNSRRNPVRVSREWHGCREGDEDMSKGSEHSGVYVGGAVSAGGDVNLGQNLAVGDGASVTVTPPSSNDLADEVSARLSEVLRALSEQSAALANRPAVFRSAAEVEDALTAKPPSKPRITAALAGLAEGVRSVASIATAVGALD